MLRIGGAWLPVTRVDAEGDAIVLSAGPLRVRARELTAFNKARDPADTASLIWPFCAPASALHAMWTGSSGMDERVVGLIVTRPSTESGSGGTGARKVG